MFVAFSTPLDIDRAVRTVSFNDICPLLSGVVVAITISGVGALVTGANPMIWLFRPLKVDDFKRPTGVTGAVNKIDFVTTTLASPDDVKTTVPTRQIYDSTI